MYVKRLCLVGLVLLALGTANAATPKEVLGKWETVDPDSMQKITLDFADSGVFKVGVGPATLEGKYSFLEDGETLEMTLTVMESPQTEKVKYKLSNNELLLTGKDSKPMKFTRTK